MFLYKFLSIANSSISNLIGVSQNVIEVMQSNYKEDTAPIILNCLTNLERSSLVALTITCISTLETDKPLIISKLFTNLEVENRIFIDHEDRFSLF